MNIIQKFLLMVVLAGTVFLHGCGTTKYHKARHDQVVHPPHKVLKKNVTYAIDTIHDPIEGFNRGVFKFNYYFDKYVFLPAVDFYQFITPDILQEGITNFFRNVNEIRNFVNAAFQLEGEKTGNTAMRFLTNTTLGVGGLWDPATELGYHEREEDFGQTLAHYDVGKGPYIMLPVFGPSNGRDTVGLIADSALLLPITNADALDSAAAQGSITGTRAVDKRANVSYRYYKTGSPFEYELVKYFYNKKRDMDQQR